MKNTSGNVRLLTLSALFAALTAVCAQVIIPIGAVPVSLSLLPVLLCAALLPPHYAALAMGAYMLMGLAGLPVFSGMGAGPAKLFGVTGGYILGYLPCAYLAGLLLRRWGNSWPLRALAMALGVLACYAFGTVWFMVTKGMGLGASLAVCVLPFLPFDAGKIALALVLERLLRRSAGSMIPQNP